MKSSEFEDYNFYKIAMDGGKWHIFVFKVPALYNKFFKGPFIGKYGKDDYVAYLGRFVDSTGDGWENAEKDETFEDIGRFVINEIFSGIKNSQ